MDELCLSARALLLAFADLGVYLPSTRDRLFRKARYVEEVTVGELARLVDLCVREGLLILHGVDGLSLGDAEARCLARSMDGHTPVPDVQARDWAQRLAPQAAA
ncbi:MAG: hypothetical protein ACYDAC_09835 [Candidatus Dormibacteria bacterium]